MQVAIQVSGSEEQAFIKMEIFAGSLLVLRQKWVGAHLAGSRKMSWIYISRHCFRAV
jgi:hypothetical protein